MKVENFAQQNEVNTKMLEILQNHFSYEETSRQMIEALSKSVAECTSAVTKLTTKVSARQTKLSIAVVAVGILGYVKIKRLEERLEKLEEE